MGPRPGLEPASMKFRADQGSQVTEPQPDQHVQKVEAAQELYKLSKRIINTLNMSSWRTLKPLNRPSVTGTADVRSDIPDIFANAHPAALTDMAQGVNDISFTWDGSMGRENLELLNRLYITGVQANAPALTAFPKAVRHFALLLASDTQKRPKAPWVRPKADNERTADNILADIEDAAYQLQENMSEIWNNYEISNIQYADNRVGNLYEYAQNITGNSSRPVSGHEAEVLIRLAPSLTQTNVQLKAQDAQLHTVKEALTLQETQVGDLMDEQKALKKRLEEQEKNMRQQPEEADLYGRMRWKLQTDLRLERMRKGID